jgi:hypothetical protein
MHETDGLGGSGLGPYWFAASDAPITDHPIYQLFSQQKIGAIDASQVKGQLATAYGSAESSPIINYLRWLLATIVDSS